MDKVQQFKYQTCGMLLNRRMWSDRVEPGKTSPPIAIPEYLTGIFKRVYSSCINFTCIHKYTFINTIRHSGNGVIHLIWHTTLLIQWNSVCHKTHKNSQKERKFSCSSSILLKVHLKHEPKPHVIHLKFVKRLFLIFEKSKQQ